MKNFIIKHKRLLVGILGVCLVLSGLFWYVNEVHNNFKEAERQQRFEKLLSNMSFQNSEDTFKEIMEIIKYNADRNQTKLLAEFEERAIFYPIDIDLAVAIVRANTKDFTTNDSIEYYNYFNHKAAGQPAIWTNKSYGIKAFFTWLNVYYYEYLDEEKNLDIDAMLLDISTSQKNPSIWLEDVYNVLENPDTSLGHLENKKFKRKLWIGN